MGQKIHPLGLRVGITKKHQSQWFARFHKNKYAQSVLEDRMLRQTLSRLFPQLLNPVFKKQRDNESSIVPKITQIKIERGLIPYEIGIQIHAENCDLIKSSIENLKVNRDFVCQLQKTRRYLQHLRFKLNEPLDESDGQKKKMSLESPVSKEESSSNLNKTKIELGTDSSGSKGSRSAPVFKENGGSRANFVSATGKNENSNDSFRKGGFRFKRLTKSQARRQRLILKRLKKRQSIRRRYKQLVREARFFLKKQGNKVIQKLTLKKNFSSFQQKGRDKRNTAPVFKENGGSRGNEVSATGTKLISSSSSQKKPVPKMGIKSRLSKLNFQQKSPFSTKTASFLPETKFPGQKKPFNILQSRIKKKFISIYRNKMNKKFLQVLKASLLKHQSLSSLDQFSGNISKKWNFQLVQPRLANKPLTKLMSLITVLEQKSLKKMESLRKDFITFGTISTSSYYQMLKFLKDLKEYVSQLKRKQKLQFSLKNSELTKRNENLPLNTRRLEPGTAMLMNSNTSILITKKLNNIENECRKIQLVDYLKQLVKKHRSDNIYLYLSTIAEARKDLRKLKQFTKKHGSFLFGAITKEGQNPEEQKSKIQERVRFVLDNSHSKADLEKTLQDIFLEQIEKQRSMYIDNVQLTPKIAIKFYTVKEKSIKAKASVVADSVVEALEQRKAFRKVIKDAKEELMRGPTSATDGQINRVKGVKIQVSGRLNGAEIARSEWVRAGRVPLQTLRANLDYSYKTANTIYGIIGVKVWIFKGYTKLL